MIVTLINFTTSPEDASAKRKKLTVKSSVKSKAALDREIEWLSAEAANYERLSTGVSSALRFGTPDFDGIRIRRLTGTRAVFALCGAILGAVAAAAVAWIASLIRRERELRTGA